MNFNEKVWQLCKNVPKGNITTYKEIANAMKTKAYRAVGNALHANPHAPIVPCHRVVNSDGRIGGFGGGVKKKIKMLKKEGVKVSSGNVVSFNTTIFKFKKHQK